MARSTSATKLTGVPAPTLQTKGSLDHANLRGAVSRQDLNKRPTAVPMRAPRSLKGSR